MSSTWKKYNTLLAFIGLFVIVGSVHLALQPEPASTSYSQPTVTKPAPKKEVVKEDRISTTVQKAALQNKLYNMVNESQLILSIQQEESYRDDLHTHWIVTVVNDFHHVPLEVKEAFILSHGLLVQKHVVDTGMQPSFNNVWVHFVDENNHPIALEDTTGNRWTILQ